MNTTARTLAISLGSLAAVGTAVAAFAAVWNSRRMKMLRAYKRTGMILDKVGIALQTLAGVME